MGLTQEMDLWNGLVSPNIVNLLMSTCDYRKGKKIEH